MPVSNQPADGGTSSSQRSAAIDIPPSTKPSSSGCCGDCGCGCGCKKCFCRIQTNVNESNREAYGGEGTLQGIGAGAHQSRSYGSTDSLISVEESTKAPTPFRTVRAAPPSYAMIRSSYGGQGAAQVTEGNIKRYMEDEDSDYEYPHDYFLEQSITSDAFGDDGLMNEAMDEGSDLFLLEMEGSMHMNVPRSSGEISMQSSSHSPRYPPSTAMSDAVRGVGTHIMPRRGSDRENCYLRLN